ncbi:hypothetical protein [Absidia glauca]|uniref:phosphogluconate dehydrogenase (NADP(+)-dependent, decarboxylating) n=1 Tax=Absidia glauca TaxID=4829 RepID=A0A168PDU6_ABSGL|nr:hypothetical protein [Absidia glauca]
MHIIDIYGFVDRADIGLIGLAVMGQNIILNMNDHGFVVCAYNRTVAKVDHFLENEAKGTNIVGAHSNEEFCAKLKKPRKVMLLVKAGSAVDAFIQQLLPYLEQGDIIIDGGNSHFPDSTRRTQELAEKGILFVGSGVSGGEEGARYGPSLMPGGNPKAWPHIKPIFQAIAAKAPDGAPCCDWVGENGAGHYVKMVHNGIALYAAKIVSYAQGYMLMRQAAKDYGWHLNYAGIALMWRGGCIIRSAFLGKIRDAYTNKPGLENLLFDGFFQTAIAKAQQSWRSVVAEAAHLGIPTPAHSTALNFYDGLRHEMLPANLIQAQRDYFGAHTYELLAKPGGPPVHTNWTGHGGNVSASTYDA